MDNNTMNDVLLREILEQLTILRKANEEQVKQLKKKDAEIERLNQILLNIQRARFGQKSEKSIYVLSDGARQISIFDTEETSEVPQATEEENTEKESTAVNAHTRKKETYDGGNVRGFTGRRKSSGFR